MRRTAAVLLVIAGLAACASGGARNRSDRNLITAEDIAATTAATAHEAVRQLRPEFLRSRGSTRHGRVEPVYAVVYVNGIRYGPPASLHTIRAEEIITLRYLSAGDATTRYGTGHVGGAIEVRTRP